MKLLPFFLLGLGSVLAFPQADTVVFAGKPQTHGGTSCEQTCEATHARCEDAASAYTRLQAGEVYDGKTCTCDKINVIVKKGSSTEKGGTAQDVSSLLFDVQGALKLEDGKSSPVFSCCEAVRKHNEANSISEADLPVNKECQDWSEVHVQSDVKDAASKQDEDTDADPAGGASGTTMVAGVVVSALVSVYLLLN